MKTVSLTVLMLATCLRVAGADEATPKESDWPLIEGVYEVIGRTCDSDGTFSGTVSIVEVKDGFRVTRLVGGKEVVGSGKVEFVTPDKIPVFRMRFQDSGVDHLGTFTFGPDLDNDGRMSGYVVPAGYLGDQPGKEVLFRFKQDERQPNQALQTTPMTRSVYEKSTEFGDPRRGV